MRTLIAVSLALAAAGPAAGQTSYLRTTTGNWSDPTGWSPPGVPGPGDTADLNGRTTIVDADATVAVLIFPPVVFSGLTGPAALTVTDTLRWEAGQSGMTDTLFVGPEAVFRVRGTAFLRMGAGGVLVNRGRMVWEAPRRWNDVGRLVNKGEIEIPIDAASPVQLCFSNETPTLTNAPGGLIRRTGPGRVYFECGFDNHGIVRVEQGIVEQLGFNANGGTDTGAYEIAAGATLVFGGGIRTLTASASVSGGGTVEVVSNSNSHSLAVGGTYDVPTTRLLGPGSPRLNVDSDVSMTSLEMTGGVLGGSGTVTVTDAMTWTGGQMDGGGTTILQPDLSLAGAALSLGGARTLRLAGTTTWSGETDITGATGATLVNVGTLLSTGSGERVMTSGSFRNEGLLVHSAGTLRFSSAFDNVGEARVEGGLLNLQGAGATGGTDTGTYAVASGAELRFSGGSRVLAASSVISGTGTVAVAGGTVANAATWRPGGSPGALAVGSNFSAGTGVLEIELGGRLAGEYDQLAVAGAATLGGTLAVSLVNGFVPAVGDRFLVVPAASTSGAFGAVELPAGVAGFVETTPAGAELVIGTVAAEPGAGPPHALALHPPAPNPAAGATTLRYDMPAAGALRLALYDALGREVAVLVDAERPAGRHEAVFDGASLTAGAYTVRMTSDGFGLTQRLTLLR